uniref:Uncharacterized protein n=1 Tax=Knipowitschia caucasica TaxID=637954 RepID=A0AAV2JKZ9_KNICA
MSTLLDHGCIRTTAVEQVVAPMASHLCHLVLLCDGAEEPEQFLQLEGSAEAVARATRNLASVAYRQAEEAQDELLQMDMSSLVESLTVSGQHVLLAAQKLNIQPTVPEHREELIAATQNVFLGVVKVLLVSDDASVRKVLAAADQVLEILSELGSSPDIKTLLRSFQSFSEALLVLNIFESYLDSEPEDEENLEVAVEEEVSHKCVKVDLKMSDVSRESKVVLKPSEFDLLPLLHEVVTVTKGKDVTALNQTCTAISDIISRARLTVETQHICDTLTIEVQIQSWAAKANYVVEEICKQDSINQGTKDSIRAALQGEALAKVHVAIKEVIPEIPLKIKPLEFPTEAAAGASTSRQDDSVEKLEISLKEVPMSPVFTYSPELLEKEEVADLGMPREAPSLTHRSLFLKQESNNWDPEDNKIVQVTRKMADIICHMTQYLKKKGPILNKDAFVTAAKEVVSNCESVTQFISVIANHCLDKQCTIELSLIVEQILTITNQLSIISSVNAVTPGSKSSDEILVKNAQNLLQTVLKGVHAAESACITGLKQPEPNTECAEATALCFQWRRNLEMHRAQQTSNLETDDLGLRKTSAHPEAPSLAPAVTVQDGYK